MTDQLFPTIGEAVEKATDISKDDDDNDDQKDQDDNDDGNDDNDCLTEIEESLCLNCGKDGTTKMLLTKIPYFREIIVMSFECSHCEFKNNELQPAQKIHEKGVRYELSVLNENDLHRQLIKTEYAQIKIPEIEFEIKQQNGLITTIEGIIDRAITGLQYSYDQLCNNEQKEQMKNFITKMIALKECKQNFTLILIDISGNSYIENFLAPEPDPQLKMTYFVRSEEEDKILGIYKQEELQEQGEIYVKNDNNQDNNLKDEVLQFSTNCPNCNGPCTTNMKLTTIPHFKDIIIMATNCDICGNRTNEIKSGAGIEPQGIRITIKIKNDDDLKKEVVRSDTCNIEIPELNLTLNSSGSGRYTTLEGLGLNMIEDFRNTNPFIDGFDSTKKEMKEKLEILKKNLSNMIDLTIILDDPCGNSFVQDADKIEYYDRTWEQNEELGLNDINTDD